MKVQMRWIWLISLLVFFMAGVGSASAQDDNSSEDIIFWVCFATIVMVIIFLLLIALAKSEKSSLQGRPGEASGRSPYYPQTSYPQTSDRRYEGYSGAVQSLSSQTQYDFDTSITSITYTRKKDVKKTTVPRICPRCRSTKISRYPSGEYKCDDCKKIFFPK